MSGLNTGGNEDSDSRDVERIFTGYQRPLLHTVAHDLVARYATDTLIDLSKATVVVSGTRVERRLMELLVAEGERLGSGRGIVPPRIITRGGLLEAFMPSQANIASEISRNLTWMAAIRSLRTEVVSHLMPSTPENYLERSASSLALRIDSLYMQLSAQRLEFSHVAERGGEVEGFYEEERWNALQEIYTAYLETLSEAGLTCRYRAREIFLESLEEFTSDSDLYLCGILELTKQQRDFLKVFRGSQVAYIFAEKSDASGFDDYGTLVQSYWEHKTLPLEESFIEVVEHPRDIAPAAATWFGSLATSFASEDAVLGIGNERLSSFIKGRLSDLGIPAREAAGTSPLHTDIGFTLSALCSYIETRSLKDVANLLRTPYVQSYVAATLETGHIDPGIFLDAVDIYQSNHLQDTTRGVLPLNPKQDALGREVVRCINTLLAPLMEGPACSSTWAGRLFDVFHQLQSLHEERHGEVVDELNGLLQEFSECPLSVELQASEVLRMMLEQFAKRLEIPDTTTGAVELLGWLEVAFDDAPSLVLTGLDEGAVPAVINSDPFLQDSLARHLGLANNQSRYTRDAALFSTIVHSKENIRIIVCRRSLSGEAIQPSRLLFACKTSLLPKRVDHLRSRANRYAHAHRTNEVYHSFLVGAPRVHGNPITKMSATSFGLYVSCPYRFYLQRIAGLQTIIDGAVELDPLSFGNLAHDVLSWAAHDAAFNSTCEATVRGLLCDGLQTISRQYFGDRPLPAVTIQIDHLRLRLEHFAQWQTSYRQDGWLTVEEERALTGELVTLNLRDSTMLVTGRIDRIDRHESTNRYRIIDYKTGEKPKTKADICQRQGPKDDENALTVWSDFQAPLYVHAGTEMYPNASGIEFGFINISASLEGDVYSHVPIAKKELADAVSQATDVAQHVYDGVFWPPNQKLSTNRENDPYWRLLSSTQEETEEGDTHNG